MGILEGRVDQECGCVGSVQVVVKRPGQSSPPNLFWINGHRQLRRIGTKQVVDRIPPRGVFGDQMGAG